MYKLQADTINGVYKVESFDGEDMKNESLFFECLADCSDGDILCCTVSDEMFKKINDKYGVK